MARREPGKIGRNAAQPQRKRGPLPAKWQFSGGRPYIGRAAADGQSIRALKGGRVSWNFPIGGFFGFGTARTQGAKNSLIVARLPTITFLRKGETTSLDLSACGSRIALLSDRIQRAFPDAENIGLLFRSGEDLVLYWLAVLEAGKTPLILQYPTKKLSRAYWSGTLDNTIASLEIGGIVCSDELRADIAGRPNVLIHDGPTADDTGRDCKVIYPRDVLQMSSGTTGMRKGIRFSWDKLQAHAHLYNQVMRLTPDDRIVSWLPLYHDMGFIAAFAMPLILGVPVVMMDPMDWVEDRGLLYDAIRDHRGTICYMPNFGFEVMAMQPCGPDDLASMRLWISCSEPTYRTSLERFCAATGTPPEKMAVCYAMAENIFAVTQETGIRTSASGGQEIVSCGAPLPDTDIRIADEQIFVRSPTSIAAYSSGEHIAGPDGFYPTGDMGFIEDGRLFVTGRTHDLLVQAGRKYFLNDFDFILNTVDPSCRGRGACLSLKHERLGTEKLVILVEREDFYDHEARRGLQAALASALPIEDFELHFVPPSFISKTSSGKINRKQTAKNFELIRKWDAEVSSTKSFEQEIDAICPFANRALPVREVVDSLGLVLIRLLADAEGLQFDPAKSLDDLLSARPKAASAGASKKAIAVVSFMDASSPGFILSEQDLLELSEALGIAVTFEHVCTPPIYFLWQDVVFRDYFLPRQLHENYKNFLRALKPLDNASLFLFDDAIEFGLGTCAFPVMDWKFRRTPLADLVAYRYQRYALHHHLLPVGEVRLGRSVTAQQRDAAYTAFSRYFNAPIFRSTSSSVFSKQYDGWDHVDLESKTYDERHARFKAALHAFIRDNLHRIPLRTVDEKVRLRTLDNQEHFCSFVVNPALIERVVARFDTFIIQGSPHSLPYLANRIRELGKKVIYLPLLNPDGTLGVADVDLDNACIVQTGGSRECVTNLPVIRLMHGNGADMKNVPADISLPAAMTGQGTVKEANAFRYIQDPPEIDALSAMPPDAYHRFGKL